MLLASQSSLSPFGWNPVTYVARAAVFQGQLLWGRVPLAKAAPSLSPERRANLDRLARVKAFATDRLGLVTRGTYDTINPTWDRVVWNVSACRPLAFEAKRYWFPFVGTVPYLGYFVREEADAKAVQLQAEGYEIWVRPAGAYSTLGWFDDPVLPGMLDWNEHRLADTVVHEIVHANVWIKGSAQFNESLANFVGQKGAIAWFAHAYGDDSPRHREALAHQEDIDTWRELLATLCADLSAVFEDRALTDAEKTLRKQAILASLPERGAAAPFHAPDRYGEQLDPEGWNNARLLQYRTYNRGFAAFEALWVAEGQQTAPFLRKVKAITQGASDPYLALGAATGVSDF